MDSRAKDPDQARANRLAAIEKARAGWVDGKPGPKVFKKGDDFLEYWMQRLEKERTDLDALVAAYCKQPFFLRCQLVNSKKMREIWLALVADVALGATKLSRERWTALSKILDIQRSMLIEEEKTERKKGREHLKQKEAEKSDDNVHEAYVVEADD